VSTVAPLVEVEGLVRRFGAIVAVDGLDLTVSRGETFGLIGPDGAGKTTALRCLLGLVRPDAGRVRVAGLDPLRDRTGLAARVGYLSQRFSLYGDLSVDENVAFAARVRGVRGWRRRRDELLDALRLTPFRSRLADRLSGGMRQKLALACTLVHQPELLVLDEPTSGVDPVSRRDLWRILQQLVRDGITVLVTTPHLDEAERCARVALVDRGRLLTTDTPERLRAALPGTMIELLARPAREAAARLRERRDVTGVQRFGERLHVLVGTSGEIDRLRVASALAGELRSAGIEVESARPIAATLEDVFIARLGDAGRADRRRTEDLA
jgi:ABC-2 type transport system ATP-binding protein